MNAGYARYDMPKGHFNINEFRGYNATSSRAISEMQDMMNLSSENYPYLSPRKGRTPIELPENIGNIEKIFRANGKLCFIADGKLWYDGKSVAEGITSEGEKSVAVCNGVICVMPDKVYYDYLKEQSGYLDEEIFFVKFPCAESGSDRLYYRPDDGIFVGYKHSNTYFEKAETDIWGNILKTGDTLSVYGMSVDTADISGEIMLRGTVLEVSSLGVKISLDEGYENISKKIGHCCAMFVNDNRKKYILCSDSIIWRISENSFDVGIRDSESSASGATRFIEFFERYMPKFKEFDTISIISGDSELNVVSLSGITYSRESERVAHCIWQFQDNSAITGEVGDIFSFKRKIPDMNYICEKDNRIFGVCNSDNTVVASKLGDPFKFFSFAGTSLDSYSVNVGSDGVFTGIVNYNGGVVLFKERYIHMLSGAKPSLFRLDGIETYGVEKGCCDSICCINGRLFYKSLRGIYVFDGSYPACVSRVFGDVKYSDAFAADDDRRYYVSMKNPQGKRLLFVYDSEGGFWHIEDSHNAVSMCELDGDIYIADAENVMKLGDNSSEAVPWYAVFGPFDMYTENKKVVSSVSIRYKLPSGSSLRVEVAYDGCDFSIMNEIFYSRDTVLFCEIPIKRCNEFSLRLSGVGDIRIQGISLTLREGTGK